MTVKNIYTYTRPTVVAADSVSGRTRTSPSIWGSMTTMLTAQRGTSPDTWPLDKPHQWNTILLKFMLWYWLPLSLLKAILILTAVVSSSGVGFILSFRTVGCSITQLIHGDTLARWWTGPFSWVALPWYVICKQNRAIIFAYVGCHTEKGKQNEKLLQQRVLHELDH